MNTLPLKAFQPAPSSPWPDRSKIPVLLTQDPSVPDVHVQPLLLKKM
jgi:hypothetical protein